MKISPFLLPLTLGAAGCASGAVFARFDLSPFLSAITSLLGGNGLLQAALGTLGGVFGVDQTFDYVVIGGGTAGDAIGVRLAEAGFKVAIVEAGEYHELSKPIFSTVPGFDLFFIGSNVLDTYLPADWGFVTEPHPATNYRRIKYTQGKCVGGSSAVNAMLYHRGPSSMYDIWAEAVGDDSYRLDQFNEFYKKSVTFSPPGQGDSDLADQDYYSDDFAPSGQGGPVQVSYANYISPWVKRLEAALQSVGLSRNLAFNRGGLLGFHAAQTTIRKSDATRSTSAEYIYMARNKRLPSLKLFTSTEATQITFDDQRRATGVNVKSFGAKYHIKAKNEVILSAGAFKSPQLLMTSGIGPRATLQEFGIPVVSALEGVGQNMWDHIFFGLSYAVKIPTFDQLLHNPVYLAEAVAQYTITHTGPFSSNAVGLYGFEKIPPNYRNAFSWDTINKLSGFSDDFPEVEHLSIDGFTGNFQSLIFQQPLGFTNYATLQSALVAPLSRGNVTIRSSSATDAPIISPNWLSDRADQEVAIALFKRMREVLETDAVQEVALGKEYWPGSKVQTDEEILNFIRKSFITVWHASCTCKMGREGDAMAVVDSAARVFGVSGLRVVDASAFPLLIPGHPSSTVYALAEKIADGIIRSAGAN
ncbi:hypothetical protein NQ176_g7851 [Zarea fungicola]|uniref:Uncharacterized protein n=1 Tax=Zarea fungicola TaxID=93591 RepID=A0ACC1MY41_9HYPO|nr:hypothetical protein NQ176_g7851 [Lecanicillium fungicola]